MALRPAVLAGACRCRWVVGPEIRRGTEVVKCSRQPGSPRGRVRYRTLRRCFALAFDAQLAGVPPALWEAIDPLAYPEMPLTFSD